MTRSIAEDFNLYAPLDCNGENCPVCLDWDSCPNNTQVDFKIPVIMQKVAREDEEHEDPYATLGLDELARMELGGEAG